jgi:hypothetical protein
MTVQYFCNEHGLGYNNLCFFFSRYNNNTRNCVVRTSVEIKIPYWNDKYVYALYNNNSNNIIICVYSRATWIHYLYLPYYILYTIGIVWQPWKLLYIAPDLTIVAQPVRGSLNSGPLPLNHTWVFIYIK